MNIPIILASASPVRARLLMQAGVPFEVDVPRLDESSIKKSLLSEGQSPRNIADALAEMKALRVGQRNPDRIVLGADQILVCDGRIYSKPNDRTEARSQLEALSGKTHQLLTAAIVVEEARPVWRTVETVSLQMRNLSATLIEDYLDLVWPDIAGCVGCYKLEAEGVRLFARITGDHYAGLGLPIHPVLSYLATRGIVPI